MTKIRLTENDLQRMVAATVGTLLEGRPIYRHITTDDGQDYEDWDGDEYDDDDEQPEEEEEKLEATSFEDFNNLKNNYNLPFEVQTFHEQRVGDKGVDLVIYPAEIGVDENDEWKILGLDWDYAPGQKCVVDGKEQPLTVGKIKWLDAEVWPKVELKINELMSQISQEN